MPFVALEGLVCSYAGGVSSWVPGSCRIMLGSSDSSVRPHLQRKELHRGALRLSRGLARVHGDLDVAAQLELVLQFWQTHAHVCMTVHTGVCVSATDTLAQGGQGRHSAGQQ